MANDRYLLAYTQTLKPAVFVSGPGNPPPYTLEIQRERLLPQLQTLAGAAAGVPQSATAGGNVVAILRMNPQALARSAFPQALLARADLRLLGSRPARVKPDGGRAATRDQPALTTELFVATTPNKFQEILPLLMSNDRLRKADPISEDFCNVEDIRLMSIEDRVKPGILETPDEIEIVLHYDAVRDSGWRDRFTRFAKSVGVQLDPGLEFANCGLLFMAATASREAASELARFTFLRAVRPLPEPRPLEQPTFLRTGQPKSVLPAQFAVDPSVSIAVFDGGLPANHPFQPWATAIEPPNHHDIGAAVPACQTHGLAVTSAALFGSIKPNTVAPRPYATVDHFRVLGTKTVGKKGLFRALALVDEILSQRSYQFISISFGPPEPIDDDNVSAWTTLLDDHLGDGSALACIAIGNNGEDAGLAGRVLVPADSVNALAVGACSAGSGTWKRAAYSAMGPGRSPGLIKPDVLHFGGVDGDPYLFACANGQVLQDMGTSFATPGAARIASGMRAHFGSKLPPIVLKALLIHCAERDNAHHPVLEVGWGRASHTLQDLTLCPSGIARVIYTGKLSPSGVLRAPILIPTGLSGKVSVRATLCYSCRTDPNTPGDYTRAGLDITFRPDLTKFNFDKKTGKPSKNPASDSFFKRHDHIAEDERRLSAQKWNTVMHAEKGKTVSSLKNPCFDLHYVARQPGLSGSPNGAPEIHYALVVSLIQKKTPDLYERVLNAFPSLVSAVEPVIAIEPPITV